MAEQSYKKHARWLPGFHFFAVPILLVNVFNEIRHVYQEPTQHSAWTLLVAMALLTVAFLSRIQALAAQDRVIRLEMRLKLRGLLPPDMQGSIDGLKTGQMVALRFASDAELTGIVKDIVAGKLTTQKEIKMSVKNWQPDFQRV